MPNITGIQMNESLSYKGLVEATLTGDCWLSFQHQPPQLPFLSKEGPDLVHVPALTLTAMSLGAGDPTLYSRSGLFGLRVIYWFRSGHLQRDVELSAVFVGKISLLLRENYKERQERKKQVTGKTYKVQRLIVHILVPD